MWHSDGLFPSIRSFENKDGAELAPARIMDAFGKMLILDQVSNLQGFKIDGVVALQERKGSLMVKVPALPSHLLMGTLQKPDGLATAFAALLAFGDTPLGFHQPLFCF